MYMRWPVGINILEGVRDKRTLFCFPKLDLQVRNTEDWFISQGVAAHNYEKVKRFRVVGFPSLVSQKTQASFQIYPLAYVIEVFGSVRV